MPNLICPICNNPFYKTASNFSKYKHHYCSRRCFGIGKTKPTLERFMEHVIINDETGCWEWKGYVNKDGYAKFCFGPPDNRKTPKAHRASWILHRGEIPEGLYVCHSCDNPPCVNPDHLFLGTQKDNM